MSVAPDDPIDHGAAVDSTDTASPGCFVNLSGYRFVPLDDLPLWQHALQERLAAIGVTGTVLLADEGINVAVSGVPRQVALVRNYFDQFTELRGLWLKQSYSEHPPFAKLKVRQRREIISFLPDTDSRSAIEAGTAADTTVAPALPPKTLQAWLDAERPLTLLDARNHYEVASGTFDTAVDLGIDTFRDFTSAVAAAVSAGTLDPNRPVVTFCTGGIRCEKAAPWLLDNGFSDVYQLDGGILNYFERVGGRHWLGDCFVFDDRVQIDSRLQPTGATLCPLCRRAVPRDEACTCQVP